MMVSTLASIWHWDDAPILTSALYAVVGLLEVEGTRTEVVSLAGPTSAAVAYK